MTQRQNDQPAIDPGSKGLDARMTELVAIGASVAGHCEPCLAYHMTKAKELGVADNLIRAAISVGHMVEKGARSAMSESARSAVGASIKKAPDCCSGAPPKDRKNCCG